VFGFGRKVAAIEDEGGAQATPSAREERTARGRVVHALLEWSQANGWSEPPPELLDEHMAVEGLDPSGGGRGELLDAVRGWLGSALLAERVTDAAGVQAEVPLLIEVEGSVLRGSIDLLVEREGDPPLVIDYKTDRLDGDSAADHAERYSIQRSIYALAVAEARRVEEVDVAYVFLERADDPQVRRLDSAALGEAREWLAETVGRIAGGEFPVAPPGSRSTDLCRGCPALGRACSGPER
jgi:ATP-dependent exoDNAse (exonuclease V) beta subunit